PTPGRSSGAPSWPTLDDTALYGLAGEIVRAVDPHTEADPAAILAHVLVMFGSAVGRGPHVRVGEVRHGTNENIVLVGQSSKSRKGTSEAPPRRIVGEADPAWAQNCIVSGLSSGEGVIWAVRDQIEKQEPIKEKGLITGYQTLVTDHGITDKRLLVIEEEFGATLKVAAREGNTLTAILRQAWDGKDLRSMTKNSPATATEPHISVIGHITRDELRRDLSSTEAANGYGNRHLWWAVKRSKSLPEGGRLPASDVTRLVDRVRQAIDAARHRGEVQRDDDARALWAEVYTDLSEGKPGLFGAVTSRAEAHVLRLSLLYALLDEAPAIGVEHLTAAIAVWDYCEKSARYIFGDATGDDVADRILAALRTRGAMTQNQLVDLFDRHVNAKRMSQALAMMTMTGLVTSRTEETGGRPRTIWEVRSTTATP
ncbi:MAG: YfjI family protein, partial [Chloroflexota bacterium]|nr:YfjI family protein [Chloroflexota bacterium]